MNVFTVIGARPQFIKASVISRAFKEYRSDVKETLIHTGQHYDQNMSKIFFDEMKIPNPDYNLGIGGGTHGENTGRMLEGLEKVMLNEKPDCVLVYGDTDSTLAAALAASKLHIPVVHIEAGLRSFNREMPEEVNRVLTDHLSSWLFAPTDAAKNNLSLEGISAEKIHVVGDVMYDAALYYKKHAREPKWYSEINCNTNEFVLCTIHRAENTDNRERLEQIFLGLQGCGLPIILPLHPRTKKKFEQYELAFPSNIIIVDPVGYLEMVWLEENCKLIATDSGGIQKEAYFHKKPCVTFRDETEWVELVQGGFNEIVGADAKKIVAAINKDRPLDFGGLIYGNGNSAMEIVKYI